jgi:hypothetical protein
LDATSLQVEPAVPECQRAEIVPGDDDDEDDNEEDDDDE